MLEPINESNSHIFDELAQDYEDEFSSTSGKKKNQNGKYSIDVDWRIPNVGYYWKEGSKIVGFSIVEPIDDYSEELSGKKRRPFINMPIYLQIESSLYEFQDTIMILSLAKF